MPPASTQQLKHAYRHLYRGLLRAVQYSKPARYVARDQLRDAFRRDDPSTFDQSKIDRTVEFLRLATAETGLEHRLVKNLLFVNWSKRNAMKTARDELKPAAVKTHIQKTAMIHYDMTVAMLNDSMGICLR